METVLVALTRPPEPAILFRFLSLPNKNQVGSCYGLKSTPLHMLKPQPLVTALGDRDSEEEINMRQGPKNGALIQEGWGPWKRRKKPT